MYRLFWVVTVVVGTNVKADIFLSYLFKSAITQELTV